MKNLISQYQKAQVSKKGFTLIEMMVSVTLFLVVMVIALGAVMAIIDGNKKTQAITSVANNLSSAVESMVRDIKTGYKYKCGVGHASVVSENDTTYTCDASSAESVINFTSTISGAPRPVQYYLYEDPLTHRKGIKKFFCPSNVNDPAINCTPGSSNFKDLMITSPDIDIQEMSYYVNNPAAGTGQPGVFIILKGTAYINKTQSSDFSIQTFVSQRLLNI